MKYRRLGSSDLNVSTIALGSWLTYSGGVARADAIACVHKALDLGVNFIDTANVYGRGAAETLLGEALQGVARERLCSRDKSLFSDERFGQGPVPRANPEADRRFARDASGPTTSISINAIDDDETTPLEETMEALTEVVRAGKARYIGFSEWPADKIEAAAALKGVARFVSSQPQYSLLWPYPQTDIFPLCADLGIGQIVWSPLAQGVLTGKYSPDAPPPPNSRASSETMGSMLPKRWLERPVLEAVRQVKQIAAEAGVSLAQFALAWVLRKEAVASAIIGASRPEQVAENAAAADISVDPAYFLRAEQILEPVR